MENSIEEKFKNALTLYKKNELNGSQSILQNILRLRSKHIDSLHLLGMIMCQSGKLDRGVFLIKEAIKINPYIPSTYFNLGNALSELKKFDEAIFNYDKALILQPNYSKAYLNKGNMLRYLNLFNDAVMTYNKAIYYDPNYAEAYNNLGIAYNLLNNLEDALSNYKKAILINPSFPEFYYNLGITLKSLKKPKESIESFSKALTMKPDYDFLLGDYTHAMMNICDWEFMKENISELRLKINNLNKVCSPFASLNFFDSPEIHKKVSRIYMEEKYPKRNDLGPIKKQKSSGKIKIGYFTSDFGLHPVSYLSAELFELSNKEKFEIVAFYFGKERTDNMHKRIFNAFDKFINVRNMDDKSVAYLSRKIGINIAVDLTGHTENNRVGIFSYRAAPIQLSYLGFLGTMGSEYYDYLIADKTLIPHKNQKYYFEKIIYLPSYQINDTKRQISDKIFTRKELNIPEKSFIYCCFNNNYKIHPSTFDGWIRILKAVNLSILYIYAQNDLIKNNLKKEAKKRGLNPDRIIFGSSIERSEYLSRFNTFDLFLDTLPYNAGTTASDSLWAGLPILTIMGQSFASRLASSILNAAGLSELITHSQKEYENKAIELALEPNKLKIIKNKLKENRSKCLLFNSKLTTKNIEKAYIEIYNNYNLGHLPKSIEVI